MRPNYGFVVSTCTLLLITAATSLTGCGGAAASPTNPSSARSTTRSSTINAEDYTNFKTF